MIIDTTLPFNNIIEKDYTKKASTVMIGVTI